MKKYLVALMAVGIAIIAFFYAEVKKERDFFRNRYLEYSYLLEIGNKSDYEADKLGSVVGDSITIERSEAIIQIKMTENDLEELLGGKGYIAGKSDFYGFELASQAEGNLTNMSLSKP